MPKNSRNYTNFFLLEWAIGRNRRYYRNESSSSQKHQQTKGQIWLWIKFLDWFRYQHVCRSNGWRRRKSIWECLVCRNVWWKKINGLLVVNFCILESVGFTKETIENLGRWASWANQSPKCICWSKSNNLNSQGTNKISK